MNTQTQPTNNRLPETTLDWFKTNAFNEHSKMLSTPSVQIALRQHLRLSYWLSKCQQITPEAVTRACKMIAFADTPEGAVPALMGQAHIDAVLCPDQGFAAIVAPDTGEILGWCIPEMLGMLEHANQGFLAGAQGRAEKAKKAAEARWAPKSPAIASPITPKEPMVPSHGSNVVSSAGLLAVAGAEDDF